MLVLLRLSLYVVLALHATVALAQPADTATQVVRGTVVDAITSTPIVGATVSVLKGGAVVRGAYTDARGAFAIRRVPLGRYTVRVTAVGREPYRADNVLVSAGKEVVLPITIEESFVAANAVVVTYDRSSDATITNSDMATVSARTFNVEDTKRYAGSLGDPSRMAQNFAGVVGANDSRNDIVVRGNSPAGMLWQMEGMNIPNPNHFGALATTGGPVSTLNNNLLAKSDFFTSAFPANYGNAVAGVFDLRMRNGNDQKLEYLAQIGFNGVELGVEGPLGGGASFLVNYRYSTLTVFSELGLDVGTGGAVPNYQDVNLRFNVPTSNEGVLTVFATGGKSDVAFLGNELDTTLANFYGDPDRNIRVDYLTGWAGIRYDHRLSENTAASITVGASGTMDRFFGDSLDVVTGVPYNDQDGLFSVQTLSSVGNIRHKFTNVTSLTTGYLVDVKSFGLRNRDNLGLPTEKINVDIDGTSTLTQVYSMLRHRLSEELTLVGGLRGQHSSLGNALAIEPRVGLTWLLGSGISMSAGYGLHSQQQALVSYHVQTPVNGVPTFTNANLGFTRSHHTVVGFDVLPTDAWRFRIEGYYQHLFDVPVTQSPSSYSALNAGTDFAPDFTDSLVNVGTGRNLGIEFTAEHFFRDGFYALATVSVFDSKYRGSDGIERNTAFNTNYVANLLVGKEVQLTESSVLALNIRLSTTGGRLLTPIDVEASALRREAVFDQDRAFSERQTPYFRTDVKLGYRVDLGGSTIEFSVDLQNVTNAQNVFLQRYQPRTNSIATEFQQGFFPVPTFRWTW